MKKFLCLLIILVASPAFAKVKVITSITPLKSLVEAVGGDLVEVTSIARGNEDPHFVEVRPSFIMAIKSAQLYVSIGMSLDFWAKPLIENARNDAIKVVVASKGISVLGLPTERVTAQLGDVHPEGNPHFWMDPYTIPVAVKNILSGLSDVDHDHTATYQANAKKFLDELKKADASWQKRLAPYKNIKVVAYHESWAYFANHFKFDVRGYVEPKPGIPPSGAHTEEVINLMTKEKIKAIIQEPTYPDSTAKLIAEKTGANLAKLPQLCGGAPKTDSYIELIDYDVTQLENAFKK